MIKPNAQGSARLTYTDIDGAEKTVLVERSLLTETETDNGLVYKKFEIPLGTKINFSVTIKTFSSGAETGTAVYNLATYVNRIEKTNPSAYTREFVNLIERMAMFFDGLKNQTQNNHLIFHQNSAYFASHAIAILGPSARHAHIEVIAFCFFVHMGITLSILLQIQEY